MSSISFLQQKSYHARVRVARTHCALFPADRHQMSKARRPKTSDKFSRWGFYLERSSLTPELGTHQQPRFLYIPVVRSYTLAVLEYHAELHTAQHVGLVVRVEIHGVPA